MSSPCADLLSKPYPETHKVELKATANNGVVFTTEAILGAGAGKKTGVYTAGCAGILTSGVHMHTLFTLFLRAATLTAKGEGVVSGNFKVDKVSVDSNKDVLVDLSLAEVVKGTKLVFKYVAVFPSGHSHTRAYSHSHNGCTDCRARDGTRAAAVEGVDPIGATIGVEHKADFGTFTVDVEALQQTVDATAVVGFDNFLVGGSVGLKAGKAFSLDKYTALVGYKAKDVTVSVEGQQKFDTLFASYHHVINPTLTVAAQAKLPRKLADTSKFELTAGVQYKTSPDVTIAGKATHTGKVAFSYAQQLSSLAKITVGAEIDSAKITSDTAHKLAVAVNFTA